MLDGNPRLNLASFVTTWMEPECDKLIQASVNKNYVDMDEYPVTTELQVRCFLRRSIAHQAGLAASFSRLIDPWMTNSSCGFPFARLGRRRASPLFWIGLWSL
jgi:hypothetical protein